MLLQLPLFSKGTFKLLSQNMCLLICESKGLLTLNFKAISDKVSGKDSSGGTCI